VTNRPNGASSESTNVSLIKIEQKGSRPAYHEQRYTMLTAV